MSCPGNLSFAANSSTLRDEGSAHRFLAQLSQSSPSSSPPGSASSSSSSSDAAFADGGTDSRARPFAVPAAKPMKKPPPQQQQQLQDSAPSIQQPPPRCDDAVPAAKPMKKPPPQQQQQLQDSAPSIQQPPPRCDDELFDFVDETQERDADMQLGSGKEQKDSSLPSAPLLPSSDNADESQEPQTEPARLPFRLRIPSWEVDSKRINSSSASASASSSSSSSSSSAANTTTNNNNYNTDEWLDEDADESDDQPLICPTEAAIVSCAKNGTKGLPKTEEGFGLAEYFAHRRKPHNTICMGAEHKRVREHDKGYAPLQQHARYILGLMRCLGFDHHERYSMSVEMVGEDAVVSSVFRVFEEKRVGPARMYQVALSLKHMAIYAAETAAARVVESLKKKRAPRAQYPAFNITDVPSWSLITEYVKQAQNDKTLHNKVQLSKSLEELIHEGKMPSPEDLKKLRQFVPKFLRDPANLKPARKPTKEEALLYMAHLIAALITTNCIAHQRAQVLKLLQLGTSLRFDDKKKQYSIELDSKTVPTLKTQKPTTILIPPEETPCIAAYLHIYRPVLVENRTHGWVFVTRNGEQRTDINDLLREVQRRYGISNAVPSQAFRKQQVTEEKEAGLSDAEFATQCLLRGHSPAVASSVYNKVARDRVAQESAEITRRLRERERQEDVEMEIGSEDEENEQQEQEDEDASSQAEETVEPEEAQKQQRERKQSLSRIIGKRKSPAAETRMIPYSSSSSSSSNNNSSPFIIVDGVYYFPAPLPRQPPKKRAKR